MGRASWSQRVVTPPDAESCCGCTPGPRELPPAGLSPPPPTHTPAGTSRAGTETGRRGPGSRRAETVPSRPTRTGSRAAPGSSAPVPRWRCHSASDVLCGPAGPGPPPGPGHPSARLQRRAHAACRSAPPHLPVQARRDRHDVPRLAVDGEHVLGGALRALGHDAVVHHPVGRGAVVCVVGRDCHHVGAWNRGGHSDGKDRPPRAASPHAPPPRGRAPAGRQRGLDSSLPAAPTEPPEGCV